MKIEVQRQEQQRVRIAGEIDGEQVRKERLRLGREYASKVSIPGFRPGKVPPELVLRRMGDEVEREVRDHLVQEALDDAMKQHSLHPSTPLQPELGPPAPDGSFSFTVEFETFPHIEVKDYLGIEVEEPVLPPVDDAMVQGSLDTLRERLARFEPREGDEAQAHEGDLAVCQVTLMDPVTGEALIDAFETRVRVGLDDEPVADAARALLGQRVGDAIEVEGPVGRITARRLPAPPQPDSPPAPEATSEGSPSEAGAPPISGEEKTKGPEQKPEEALRVVKARIEVRQLLERRVPLADDAFAKRVGHSDIESLKADLRKRLEEERQAARKDQILEAILKRLEEAHPIALGEQTLEGAIRDESRRALMKILGPSNLHLAHQMEGIELPRETIEPAARRGLHRAWIIENIARQERVEVSSEDLENEIGRIAEESGITPEEVVRVRFPHRSAQMELISQIRIRKVLDLLTRYAVVRPPAPPPSETAGEAPAMDESTPEATPPADPGTPVETPPAAAPTATEPSLPEETSPTENSP